MSLLTRAGDLVYTFRFLKLLVTPFEETDAYKNGIIDENGKRIKSKTISSSEKSSYTPFHRLVFNIKKLLEKIPGGKTRIASYAAALFLLKEKYSLSDKNIERILKESGVDILDMLQENSQWYLLENGMLSPGVYRLTCSKVLNDNMQELAMANDKIRIFDESYPVGNLLGIDIYEAKHINTNQSVYVAVGELQK
jgi:hypothetical protein